ncbi:MAG: hemerythrin domain-containing protein [Burkholderiaceae bacterium]|nr:hemerythrin domain-containing protein [Sulfuritalea sp.]MCF8176644.1 hemerythrin domain-containing protein [Burkholderiaceae bacterium]MCF8183483.1 hemerythrin domain-containing protein [Polynucleobacter sp.]
MKRHPDLVQLSREHHGALKLARAARRAAESGDAQGLRETAQRVVKQFAAELEPHFRVEERDMLLRLTEDGQHDLVQRTLSEHAELRRLEAALAQPDAASLLRFGDLLAAHVRFEERELFEAVQNQHEKPG